jgi:aminomethyltransferase
MQRITDIELDTIGFYEFKEGKVNNIECLLSRTGYTGEDGFEIYLKPNDAPAMWQKLVELAEEVGGSPAGLGCRDTLRFEAVYMLYGNELNDNSTPLEAGIKWSVDFNKDFMGKDSLVKQKEEGLKVMLRGVEILDKMPVRHEYEVYSGEQKIGYITSGAKSPSTGKNLALAYIEKPFSKIGANIQIKARNKMLDAVLIKKPFYRGSVKNS